MANCRHSPQCQCFERIAELEGQLFASNSALLKAGIWQGESQKREAVLVEALEDVREVALKAENGTVSGPIIGIIDDAKAALEVK